MKNFETIIRHQYESLLKEKEQLLKKIEEKDVVIEKVKKYMEVTDIKIEEIKELDMPKKKRGWPAGVKRGPRKPALAVSNG